MKRLIVVSLLLLLAAFLVAKPVSDSQALRVAENWMLECTGTAFSNSTISPLNPGSRVLVVNLRPSGYVLIAGDDAATPILGYQTEHAWGEFEIPIQLQDLLRSWEEQLQDIGNRDLQASAQISASWQHYDVESSLFRPDANVRTVSPLIQSTWGQGGYYNDLCPANTPVGCVATAMSQIMKYWNFPTVGNGSHSYNSAYGTLTANFGSTTYNWAGMPNQVGSPNTSVATLCFHAGVAVDMDYDPTGSGAYSTLVPPALENYFKYQTTAELKYKSSYSEANWHALLQGELNNARPVYYAGTGPSGGHAFIVDGWQNTNHYHFNWGWDGYYDGYYYLTALNPGGDSFTSNQEAVIGIQPTQSSANLGEDFEGTTFPPVGWTVTTSTWARSATNFIAGAFSARYNVTANGTTASGKQLRTPKLTVNASSPALGFKARAGTTLRAEELRIGYSTSPTGPYTYLANAVLTTSVQTFTRVVSGLTPGDYYFVFETYSSNAQSNSKTWILDDVTGPALATPVAGLNISSWSAGNVDPGSSASSGLTFQLSNTGGGILSITSVTNLSASEFKSTINPAVQLVYGQVHEFGFSYDPLNYGTDSQTFEIVTNGGTLTISLSGQATANLFGDGFENYTDFALSFPPWTQYDGDGSTTYSITDVTFTNQGYTGSYVIFNASQCTPDMSGSDLGAQSGYKGAYCFAATTAPNNDWLISPQFSLVGPTCKVGFWAKSYTDQYGLERFKVRYSTTTNAFASFTNYLAGSATAYISAPITWTYYEYTLPTTAKYVAIQCVSSDAFIFMVDNFVITDSGQTPPTPTFGNLSGYVYEYGTSNPIANAVVNVGAKSATTNSSGYYEIFNLLVGSYGGNCSTPGLDYFPASVSGIVITAGATTTQDFSLKWSELAVNANAFTANLYLGQTDNQTLTISNPGGTADLVYDWYYLPYAGANREPNANPGRALPVDPARAVPELPVAESRTAVNGWMNYGAADDAAYYTSYVLERATNFTLADWGLWSDSGVTVSQLEAYFYQPTDDLWGAEDTFRFKIYGADGSTVLYTSPSITAVPNDDYIYPTTYTLDPALNIDGDFYVAVVPEGTTSGKPYGLSAAYSYGTSYYGSAGAWTGMADEEHIISAFVDGNWWVYASPGSGVVAPTESEDININFDTTDLSVGTYQGVMIVVNNSDYIAPSGRGDDLAIPLTLNVLAGGTTGNVQGHVYLAGTSTPVADALVALPYYEPVYTDANGFYNFTGVVGENNPTISASAQGCQNYSGALAIQGGQTITRDIYLDYSEFSTPQTSFTLNCYLNGSTSATTNLSNLGTWAVDWEADSGIWGGPTYNAGPLDEDFEDMDISGWSGLVGPNSDIYTGYGYNSSANWVFASQGTTETQYIISPMLKPDATSSLSFWYQQYNDSNEVLQIMVSRTDTAIGSFQPFATINMTTANYQVWAQYTASLAAYAEEDHIYVCLYYPRTDGYQYGYVMIDDIAGPDVYLPYSEWLSSTPAGTLAAGASAPLTLTANAAGLPVGTYTAQAWVFGNAINEPYKLYVTLNVSEEPQGVGAPQNLLIVEHGTYVELAWDPPLEGIAHGYHVYCCDDPYGTYQHLLTTDSETLFAEFLWADITALGYDASKAFFRVTADTEAPLARSLQATSRSRNLTPALDRLYGPTHNKTLKKTR